MDKLEAYDYYTKAGIIVHPLVAPVLGDRATGKSPIPKDWQIRQSPYHPAYITQELNRGCNIGMLCGKASDITVIDFDWVCKGIIEMLFDGLDTSKLVKQYHGEGKKFHYIFRYCNRLTPGQKQDIGFDILGQNPKGGGSNCVCAPSVHADGTTYILDRDINERSQVPLILADRINYLIDTYAGLQEVLLSCRAVWRKLWRALFTDKSHELYHYTRIFRGEDGRTRHLGLFAELRANGATDEMLMLACMLIFGNDFNYEKCVGQLRHVDPTKPMRKESMLHDSYLSLFYPQKGFDPFTESIEKLEQKLDADAIEVYEQVLINAPAESFDAVQRAFLVGYLTR